MFFIQVVRGRTGGSLQFSGGGSKMAIKVSTLYENLLNVVNNVEIIEELPKIRQIEQNMQLILSHKFSHLALLSLSFYYLKRLLGWFGFNGTFNTD